VASPRTAGLVTGNTISLHPILESSQQRMTTRQGLLLVYGIDDSLNPSKQVAKTTTFPPLLNVVSAYEKRLYVTPYNFGIQRTDSHNPSTELR